MPKTQADLNVAFEKTDWKLKKLYDIARTTSGIWGGKLTLTDGEKTEEYEWRAVYKGDKWSVSGSGALNIEKKASRQPDSYPFSFAPSVNYGVQDAISDWLESNSQDVAINDKMPVSMKKVAVSAPVTQVTPPTPVAKPSVASVPVFSSRVTHERTPSPQWSRPEQLPVPSWTKKAIPPSVPAVRIELPVVVPKKAPPEVVTRPLTHGPNTDRLLKIIQITRSHVDFLTELTKADYGEIEADAKLKERTLEGAKLNAAVWGQIIKRLSLKNGA